MTGDAGWTRRPARARDQRRDVRYLHVAEGLDDLQQVLFEERVVELVHVALDDGIALELLAKLREARLEGCEEAWGRQRGEAWRDDVGWAGPGDDVGCWVSLVILSNVLTP